MRQQPTNETASLRPEDNGQPPYLYPDYVATRLRAPKKPGPYVMDDLGRDVLALLDGIGAQRFSFCGLSIGGMVGMWLASEVPERVERLVLCCTAASFDPDAYSSRARTVREHGVWKVADAVLERWFTPEFRATRPDVVEWAGWMLTETPSEGYAGCCEAISGADLSGRLGGVHAPTLVIAGAEDPAAPPDRAESIRDSVPDARLTVLSPAAHLANVESPEATTEAILEHLQARPRVEGP